MEKTSVFDMLSAVNCNEHIEKKNGLTYLPWAWAWHMVKKLFPNATFIIYENADGWPYWTDGRYCWVKVGVIIEGIEHIEYLPIMDYKNNSIPWEKVTSMDVNKSIQRALTKACARHGLGLYIYAGEDLPEDVQPEPAPKAEKPADYVSCTAVCPNGVIVNLECSWLRSGPSATYMVVYGDKGTLRLSDANGVEFFAVGNNSRVISAKVEEILNRGNVIRVLAEDILLALLEIPRLFRLLEFP